LRALHSFPTRRSSDLVPIVSVQNRYSFADREWDYVADYCVQNGIAFIPWFPLGAGRVAGQTLDQIARAHQATPHQVAIAWLLKRDRKSTRLNSSHLVI